QRAVRADRGARPGAAASLPADPTGQEPAGDRRAERWSHPRGAGGRQRPQRRFGRHGTRAAAHRPRGRAQRAHDGRRRRRRGPPRRRARAPGPKRGGAMRATRIRAGLDEAPTQVDLLVVGLGVTGVGVALDAVSRGLSVLAVDAHDLAFGTSRWSSKLVHGGLRYLANGQLGVAHESAVERGILMEVTAPHLTHALPVLPPLASPTRGRQAAFLRAGTGAGDPLGGAARPPAEPLPPPRRVTATESRHLAPVLGSDVRGGILSWDGQLED